MSITEAHRKLGHISHTAIKHALSSGHITGIELDHDSKPDFCEACAKAKAIRLPFPKQSQTRANKYGERVHWDLWGPASVQSLAGNSYVAARIDDATRETKLYFQKRKSSTYQSYSLDEAYIETQTGNRIKACWSDRGGEFLSKELTEHQDHRGTVRELTVHDSPPQNGTAERGMRTRTEQARALLLGSGLPRFLWEEAMKHSAWLQNQSPTQSLDGKMPYEARHGKKPHLAGIQEFGVAAYVKQLNAGKLDARAQLGWFVGYDHESKGYRIYWPTKWSVTVEHNVVFNENDISYNEPNGVVPGDALSEGETNKIIQSIHTLPARPSTPVSSQVDPPLELQSIKPTSELENDRDELPEPEMTRRPRKPPGAYRLMHEGLTAAFAHDDEQIPESNQDTYLNYALIASDPHTPRLLEEALRGPDREHWKRALDYEISQLEKLGTWTIEDLPKGQTTIPCTEVLKEKRGPTGDIEAYRVRIVAGGHKQVEGVNYTETFSAAAKLPSVHVILANAASLNWEIHQVDVKSAYLNAPLKETVYMNIPRGAEKLEHKGKVCRLLKGMYGLKQAGRGWHQELTRVFTQELGFQRSDLDHSIFKLHNEKRNIIVAVATDDMLITSNSLDHISNLKADLSRYWGISDIGEARWYLGFEIKRDRAARTISINQSAYLTSMAAKFRLSNAKPVTTPIEPGVILNKEQAPLSVQHTIRMRNIPYAEAIGSVLWPVIISRPDAAFAIGTLSQFIQNPAMVHWEALKRLIVYLYSTKDLWLTFGGANIDDVEAFCDADWASQAHRHSILGFSFHMGVGAVSWSCKKQNIIALSSTEAEYIALTHAAKEAIWLRNFLGEIRGCKQDPIMINCDNQGAIALSKDNKFHARTKHIEIRYHYIRECVAKRKIVVKYVPTADNVADVFTKPLA